MSDNDEFDKILDGFWPYRKSTRAYRAVPFWV